MVTGYNVQPREKHAPQTAFFPKFARNCVRVTEHPVAFGLAVVAVLAWAVTGPIFKFSDSWQLAINTGTTIITFLMVFLIQNSQNRDTEAIQLKLAELIRATQSAHNAFLVIEELSEEELNRIKANLGRVARKAREDLRTGKSDPGCPEARPDLGLEETFRWDFAGGKSTRINGIAKHQTKEYV
jgi:low affinity Fe/Cu permease